MFKVHFARKYEMFEAHFARKHEMFALYVIQHAIKSAALREASEQDKGLIYGREAQ